MTVTFLVFLGNVLINVGKHVETESLIKKKAFQRKRFFGNTSEQILTHVQNIPSSNESWGKNWDYFHQTITFQYLLSHT